MMETSFQKWFIFLLLFLFTACGGAKKSASETSWTSDLTKMQTDACIATGIFQQESNADLKQNVTQTCQCLFQNTAKRISYHDYLYSAKTSLKTIEESILPLCF
jgi:hypothetical protein